jgi:adenylate cyclase class 2
MTDHLEIEIKFALANPDEMRESLRAIGAEYRGKHSELNLRLDNIHGDIDRRDMVLRLRRTETDDGAVRHVLTVKQPDQDMSNPIRVRREVEVAIKDPEELLAALELMGYYTFFLYEKQRETYHYGAAEIVIDEMPYGWFMEIEGEPEIINELTERLGLDPADAIPSGYTRMFRELVAALDLKVTDLTFENFTGIDIDPSFWKTGQIRKS